MSTDYSNSEIAVPTAAPYGGASHAKLRNLAGTATAIKTAPGTLYALQVINGSAATAFVQLFDSTTGNVVPGTTTPDLELMVAAGAMVTLPLPAMGVAFSTAISAISATAEGGGTGSAAGVQLTAQYA